MYSIRRLKKEDWSSYKNLMLQSVYSQLEQLDDRGRLFMVGAEDAGQPLGLVVLELERRKQAAFTHSLFVAEPYRRQGLATLLLDEALCYCSERQIAMIKLAYYTGKSATKALEAWLHNQGWTEPELEAVVFHIDRSIAGATWLQAQPALPQSLRLLRWNEIDRSLLDQLAAGNGSSYPEFLSPFKTIAPMEERNSVGIISPDGVEGWSTTYRIAKDTVLYDAIYTSPRLQQSGLALLMLAKSIALQLEAGIEFGLFTVNTGTPIMLKLARKWLAPYAYKVNEKKICYLQLK